MNSYQSLVKISARRKVLRYLQFHCKNFQRIYSYVLHYPYRFSCLLLDEKNCTETVVECGYDWLPKLWCSPTNTSRLAGGFGGQRRHISGNSLAALYWNKNAHTFIYIVSANISSRLCWYVTAISYWNQFSEIDVEVHRARVFSE